MTIEELKNELSGMDLPTTNFKMSAWENVTDVQAFLNTQYEMCEIAGEKYLNSVAWERLMRFYEAVKGIEKII